MDTAKDIDSEIDTTSYEEVISVDVLQNDDNARLPCRMWHIAYCWLTLAIV